MDGVNGFLCNSFKKSGWALARVALPQWLVSTATQAIPAQAKPGGWSIWKEKSDLMYGH